jgi:hypothetical protein
VYPLSRNAPGSPVAELTLSSQIRLTLNSFATNLQSTAARPGSTPADVKVAQAERYCYDLASDSLSQVKVLHDIDRNVLHRSQDSVSIMVACEWHVRYPLGTFALPTAFSRLRNP